MDQSEFVSYLRQHILKIDARVIVGPSVAHSKDLGATVVVSSSKTPAVTPR